jgi:hypothetical protein
MAGLQISLPVPLPVTARVTHFLQGTVKATAFNQAMHTLQTHQDAMLKDIVEKFLWRKRTKCQKKPLPLCNTCLTALQSNTLSPICKSTFPTAE